MPQGYGLGAQLTGEMPKPGMAERLADSWLNTPSVRPYEPPLRERIGNLLFDAFRGAGLPNKAEQIRRDASQAVDFVPFLGEAVGADETSRAFQAGNYGDAALLGAGTLVGAVPGVGDVAKKGLSGLRSSSFSLDYFGTPIRVLQNPSPQSLKGFLNRTKYKAARRVIDKDTGDVFVWDANDPALHELIAKELAIKNMEGDVIGLEGVDTGALF